MVFAKPKPRYQRWQRIFLSLEINCVKLMVVGCLSKELTGQHDRSVFPLGKIEFHLVELFKTEAVL